MDIITNAKKRKRLPPPPAKAQTLATTNTKKGRRRRSSPKKKKRRRNAAAVSVNEVNPFLAMPGEILTQIATYLENPRDLSAVAMSCCRLRSIALGEPSIWVNLAKKLGYARGITGADMNNLSKTYLVLWSVFEVRNSGAHRIPIVGLVHGVTDPVRLQDVSLTSRILRRFKRLIEDLARSFQEPKLLLMLEGSVSGEGANTSFEPTPFPSNNSTTTTTTTTNVFKRMTTLSDSQIFERASAKWAIGPLGCEISHLEVLEYATHNCFTVVNRKRIKDVPDGGDPIKVSETLVLSFEIGMCGMALTAIHSELKQRAYYVGNDITHGFRGLVTACPAAMEKDDRVVVEKLRKQFAERDTDLEPWCSGALLSFHEKT